jgi:hypothetical protein
MTFIAGNNFRTNSYGHFLLGRSKTKCYGIHFEISLFLRETLTLTPPGHQTIYFLALKIFVDLFSSLLFFRAGTWKGCSVGRTQRKPGVD